MRASKHRNCSNSLLGKSGKSLIEESSCCAVPAAQDEVVSQRIQPIRGFEEDTSWELDVVLNATSKGHRFLSH